MLGTAVSWQPNMHLCVVQCKMGSRYGQELPPRTQPPAVTASCKVIFRTSQKSSLPFKPQNHWIQVVSSSVTGVSDCSSELASVYCSGSPSIAWRQPTLQKAPFAAADWLTRSVQRRALSASQRLPAARHLLQQQFQLAALTRPQFVYDRQTSQLQRAGELSCPGLPSEQGNLQVRSAHAMPDNGVVCGNAQAAI